MAEGRDWTRMQSEACPDCGHDSSLVADGDMPRALTDAVVPWAQTLATADVSSLRRWPGLDVWSPLEYACHTRDVIAAFEERVRRTAVEPGQQLGWWDHEAAVTDERYNEQVPVLVAEAMAANARRLAHTLADLDPATWDSAAERRPGEHFTIRGMAGFVLHEIVHHRWDAEGLLDATRA
ncbi:MAG: DinB family protein [Actinomycetota bacterium]